MKRVGTILLLLVVLLVFVALPVEAVSLRRQCSRECRSAISSCVQVGGHRRRCRRTVLRRCRTEGLTVCASVTTTTIVPGGGTTTTLPGPVNGCVDAADLTGHAAVTIEFGGAHGFHYAPACFRVSAGTRVTFSGAFGEHPLVGGEVTDSTTKVPDPASPFAPRTASGTTKTFTLATPGAFPFYCDNHALVGMKGAAFVSP